ncbi:PnuC-like nicotinamide mononucleotide transport [Escherichia phage 4MG]|uniref:Nicotinamide monocucleotide transport n=1 Tax=Escherichia phage 4MG TaxID=1391428 RepID=V5KSH6_9CAUD|nr:PnuC-like nicotinamide mononucleotide transport [Escherichia phage 4MG]AGZ17500.1 nicotinamide monocucleotide transport [Escherichia phage 4MG]
MNTNLYIKTAWTDFYGWTNLEYLWLLICSASIATVSIVTGGTMVEFISSVTGIVGAILVAKGKLSSYYWGFIATVLYAYVSFTYKLYGETIMYTVLFTPMQVIGGIIWARKLNVSADGERADVIKRYLTTKQRWLVGLATAAAIVCYALFIKELKGSLPGPDAATAILSVLATWMMVVRLSEQWYVWIIVNIVAVGMWVNLTLHHQGAGAANLAMWVTFLLNSVYGAYKWRKTEKETAYA